MNTIIRKLSVDKEMSMRLSASCVKMTKHMRERYTRLNAILDIEPVDIRVVSHRFVCDNNENKPLTIHEVTQQGFVYIYNLFTEKLITIIAPDTRQMRIYYRYVDDATQRVLYGLGKRNELLAIR